jgi:hypothetical protein
MRCPVLLIAIAHATVPCVYNGIIAALSSTINPRLFIPHDRYMANIEKGRPRGRYGCLHIHKQGVTLGLAVITALCMSFTIFFAYNSSLEQPYLSSLITQTPERSILILNLASHLTLFALGELTSSVLEATRWALACSATGTTALTFITLSRATSFIGALYLSLVRSGSPEAVKRHAHQIWGGQRCEVVFVFR